MKGPWVKVWRNVFADEKIAFITRRYGHEAFTFWIGILTQAEDGVLEMDEDVFADLIQIEEKRYQELRGVLIKRGLVFENEDGRLEVSNWAEYQVADSTERSRECRRRKREAAQATLPPEPSPATAPEPMPGDEAEQGATLRQRGCNAEATTEGEGEGEEENSHTPREDKPKGPDPDPHPIPDAPGESVYPKLVYEAWSRLGERAYQPASYLHFANATWHKIRPYMTGIHSDLILQALTNFGKIILAPPGRFFWDQRIPIETFFERHLPKFLPGNFKSDDFLLRRGSAQPRSVGAAERAAEARAAWDAIPDGAGVQHG